MQRHAHHGKKAEREAGYAPILPLPERRRTGAAQQQRDRRHDVGAHEQRQRKQKAAAERGAVSIARSVLRAADQQHESREEEHIRRWICEAARRPFDVLHETRSEQHADRDRGKDEGQRQAP